MEASADDAFDDVAAQRLLEVGRREEELREEFRLDGHEYDRMSVSYYTAYAAMIHEDRGWRQLFPAVPSEEEARLDLGAILRVRGTERPEFTSRFERAADAVERGDDQVIISEDVFRVVRVEQTVIMTSHGPQPPRAGDLEFAEELDERPGAGG
ncbi:DUF5954 family protein [Streptomyces sp. NBC_01498]|uniref:DUF5954 family protein n=1 Tax=Streptomyces sp. NBC_01498 TaxID=2975870 RepID=UPI002E7C442A|nr:DUF5954 family protein [Streptomyces sp. NBC_01498]WTL28455.1 DUF5954 family protein [Streptomyces sp. NBC_01498]